MKAMEAPRMKFILKSEWHGVCPYLLLESRKENQMANQNRGKRNQPPTGKGKKQAPYSGAANKLRKRSEVLQARRGRFTENILTAEDETAVRSAAPFERANKNRRKAGR
jgi:hypothetical protein